MLLLRPQPPPPLPLLPHLHLPRQFRISQKTLIQNATQTKHQILLCSCPQTVPVSSTRPLHRSYQKSVTWLHHLPAGNIQKLHPKCPSGDPSVPRGLVQGFFFGDSPADQTSCRKELVPLKHLVKLRWEFSANDTSRHPKVLKIGPNHGCQ